MIQTKKRIITTTTTAAVTTTGSTNTNKNTTSTATTKTHGHLSNSSVSSSSSSSSVSSFLLLSKYIRSILIVFIGLGCSITYIQHIIQFFHTLSIQQQQPQQQPPQRSTTTNHNNNNQKRENVSSSSPLNIVLFYADDWTYTTLGLMGNINVHTPHMDNLVQNDGGILFTHNCVVTSVCMQSRATLYTGQYSSVHETYYSWKDVTMYQDGKWNVTLYPIMTSNQYHTGFFGKYHHLEQFQDLPPTFTEFRSTEMSHTVQCSHRPNGRNNNQNNNNNHHHHEQHVTLCNEQDGIDFITNRPKDQPFFLTLSFFATHAQDGSSIHYQPQDSTEQLYPPDYIIPSRKTHTEEHWKLLPPFFNDRNVGRSRYRGRYDTSEVYQDNMKRMYRMANEVDAACGKIINLLKEQGVYDNTMIIFTTDNGNFHGEHGLSEKWYAYEESIRVPLIIRDPRTISSLRGSTNTELTLNIDLAPTILSAANIPIPSIMQGRDIATMYTKSVRTAKTATDQWRKEFLYEFWDNNDDIPNSIALVGQDFKYIYWNDHNYTQYFDLANDPYEEFDLYTKFNTTITEENLFKEAQRKLTVLQQSVKAGLPQ